MHGSRRRSCRACGVALPAWRGPGAASARGSLRAGRAVRRWAGSWPPARRGARHGLLEDLAGLKHDDPPGQNGRGRSGLGVAACRARFVRTAKVPRPRSVTASPCGRLALMAARTASMAFSAVCLGRSVAATIRATRSTFRIGFRSFAWNGSRAATRLHRSETCEIPGCQVRAGGVGGPRPRAAGRWGRGWTASGGGLIGRRRVRQARLALFAFIQRVELGDGARRVVASSAPGSRRRPARARPDGALAT